MNNLVCGKKRGILLLAAISTIAIIWILQDSAVLSRILFSRTQHRSILHFGSNSKVAVVSFLAGNSEAEDECR